MTPSARRALLVASCLLAPVLSAPDAEGAFVQTGLIMAGATFSGWNQAGAYSILDTPPASDDYTKQDDQNIHKVWIAFATQNGGTAAASASNPITQLYLRIDHMGTKAGQSGKFAMQMNLGAAAQGKVDHLFQFEVTGTNTIDALLLEYTTPYPDLGAFTTSSVITRFSNDPNDSEHKPGLGVRTGKWDASQYGVEISIPVAWLTDSPNSQFKADGTGAPFFSGAFFSATGNLGSVGSVKDTLGDGSGQIRVLSTSTTTGTTTFQPATAKALAFIQQPSNAPAGGSLGTITVDIRDGSGNKINDATHEVAIAIANDGSGGGAVLSGTKVVAAVAGTATFTGLSIDKPGTGYTLRASAAGLTAVVSTAFNIQAAPQVTVAADPVTATGVAASGARWGGWVVDPGQSGVVSANYLKVTNSGQLHATKFTVDFTPSTFVGVTDASWTIPLDTNIEFACAQTTTGQPPSALTFTFQAASATGSGECTFTGNTANGAGVMYVQYRLVSIPATAMDQAYSASFTVTEAAA